MSMQRGYGAYGLIYLFLTRGRMDDDDDFLFMACRVVADRPYMLLCQQWRRTCGAGWWRHGIGQIDDDVFAGGSRGPGMATGAEQDSEGDLYRLMVMIVNITMW